MSQLLSAIVKSPKSVLIVSVILGSIFLISLLFPKQTQFNYQYEKGKTWDYPDLIASLDFYVWKKKSEIQAEKEEKITRFRPIYNRIEDHNKVYSTYLAQLEKAKTKLPQVDYESLRLSLIQNSSKEIVADNDLKFEGRNYNILRLEVDNAYQELGPDDYILSSDFESLVALIGDQEGSVNPITTIALNNKQSEIKLNLSIDDITAFKRKISKGEVIAAKGTLVSDASYDSLEALRSGSNGSGWHSTIVFLGYILLTCLIIGVYILYIMLHYPDLFYSVRRIGFLLLLIVVMSFLVYSIERTDGISTYIIPFCIVPIVVKSFFSDRLALFTHIVIVLIASFLSVLDYEFTFLEILAGIVAVLVIEDTKSWNKFFISIFSILGAYFIGYLGLCLIRYQAQVPIDWDVYKWLALSGVLTLLAYPFIPLLAKVFGFVSSITLTDLGDLSNPLLKELSLNAPGTLQHSLQVANLSEAAADQIGANALLLKVGALYHDIGKLRNPSIFIENQHGMNPHDHLSNFESARAIIDHIPEGIKMAKKQGLPKPIIDLIATHHGTTRVEYFYRNQLKDFPDKEFDEGLFRYPGPKPTTREETILMLADSIEAASKSLKSPTGQDIDNLVESIIDFKIKNDQLSDSQLSFEELGKCVDVFKSMLRNINHVRVEYPAEEVSKV